METELKFAISPEPRDHLERHSVSLAESDGASTQSQRTTYYVDTPDRTLRKAGFTLRVRDADGRFVQTVKSARAAARCTYRPSRHQALPIASRKAMATRMPGSSGSWLMPATV